jgi:hypothetical protein
MTISADLIAIAGFPLFSTSRRNAICISPAINIYAQHEQSFIKFYTGKQPLAESTFCTWPTIEVDLMAAL